MFQLNFLFKIFEFGNDKNYFLSCVLLRLFFIVFLDVNNIRIIFQIDFYEVSFNFNFYILLVEKVLYIIDLI